MVTAIQKAKASKAIGIVAKNQLVVNELCTKYKFELMRCDKCPVLKECNHTKAKMDSIKDDAKKLADEAYEEEVQLDKSAENVIRAQEKRNHLYNQYFRNEAGSIVHNQRCFFEKNEIISILEKFGNSGYDLGDPRVFIILNDLLGNILTIGRMNKIFTQTGLLMSKESASGPSYYTNPLLKSRNELSENITEAMTALDKMMKTDESTGAADEFVSFLSKQLKIKKDKQNVVEAEVKDEDDNKS